MPVGIDNIARGLASKALKGLEGKANLVDGKIPAEELPSYVDDVVEYDTKSVFPNPGEAGKIYVAKDTNLTYRWSGSDYILVGGIESTPLFLAKYGETSYDDIKEAFDKGEVVMVYDTQSGIDNNGIIVNVCMDNSTSSSFEFEGIINNHTYHASINQSGEWKKSLWNIQPELYSKDVIVKNSVGGLQAGFKLKEHTIENIIERLVGAYVGPSFTESSIKATYSMINTRTGTDENYCLGDTVQLKSVHLVLTKGTDYDGIVEGSIMENNNIVYSLSKEEIELLNNSGKIDITLENVEHKFPEGVTSDSVEFATKVSYNQKSYDANEEIITNKVDFAINSATILVEDEETYGKLYVGALPTGAIIKGLLPNGTVNYDVGGSVNFEKKDSLGNVSVTTTDECNKAVFISEDLLTDITFLGFSDIANWGREEQIMSYTRPNGKTYEKKFHVYSQIIAVDTFTYELE